VPVVVKDIAGLVPGEQAEACSVIGLHVAAGWRFCCVAEGALKQGAQLSSL
jgi:hypothetical protein